EYQRTINRARSRCRARGEHAFHVVKRLWGFAKVRYRGLAKNTARTFASFALANLYLVRRRLLPRGAQFALCAAKRQKDRSRRPSEPSATSNRFAISIMTTDQVLNSHE